MRYINKNNLKTFCLFLFVSLFTTTGFSQSARLDKASSSFKDVEYINAMSVYQDVANSGYRSIELFTKLGDAYYFNSKYDKAVKYYSELFAMTDDLKPIYYLRYAQSLKSSGSNDLAAKYYDMYLDISDLDTTRVNAENAMGMIDENSGRYDINKLSLNSSSMDFGTAFYQDKIIFSSARDTSAIFKKRSGWDGHSFLDLYESTIDSSGSFSTIEKLKGDINGKYHESTPTFTKSGKTVYFTRNNFSEESDVKKEDQLIHLKIYRAQFVNDEWTQIQDLPINGDEFSTAHPVLNSRENKLYFVSNRPGSVGETDLFYVDINNDGSFGEVKHLGGNINTAGRESFPFITANDELYFSSDGHFGLGGYDVFYTKIENDNFSNNVLNVGAPVNSSFDDICYIVDNNRSGYFSSNRTDEESNNKRGEGLDNIYKFKEKELIKDLSKSKIFGVVFDSNNNPILNASVTVSNENNEKITTLKTNQDGYYEYNNINQDHSYIIVASKPTYVNEDLFSDISEEDREHNFILKSDGTILVESSNSTSNNNEASIPTTLNQVKIGDDLAKVLNIVIHFDLNESYIRDDAKVELEKLVSVLKSKPSLKVDVRSHTDSRADDDYNLKLSNSRAFSTMNYLVNRGISRDRLTGSGYGEYLLVNNCFNGSKCSEQEHQRNRRSEFLVR